MDASLNKTLKLPKYGFFSDPFFSVFGLNTEKYRPKKTPYLEIIRSEGGSCYLYIAFSTAL